MTIRSIRLLLFFFSFSLFILSCSKINEATDLGDGIIPGVDGVTTFDTIIYDLETYNGIVAATDDSIRVGRTEGFILGNISDPMFGKTTAKIFFELKPSFYKWNFHGVYKPDSLITLDSVVLCLGWNAVYGDTMAPVNVKVYEIDPAYNFRMDTFYLMREQYVNYGSLLLGSRFVIPASLNDSVKAFEDSSNRQLRIRLNNSFGRRLLNYDTTTAYASDSAFKTYFRGFAVDTDPSFGNALMSFGMSGDADTKLAIYYTYQKNGVLDTTVDYFSITGASVVHNYIERYNFTNPGGLPIYTASTNPGQDDKLYLINTPGSYATIKIPGLKNLSTNRIIHRAELIAEQVYDPTNVTFGPPEALMLDVFDTAVKDYKYIPYDFAPDQSGSFLIPFGVFGKSTVDGFGNPIRVWKFNVTRYVQSILTQKEPLHDFRLFTTYSVSDRMRENTSNNTGGYGYYTVPLNSQYAFGRVVIGGANHPTQKMRLRIIYSKT